MNEIVPPQFENASENEFIVNIQNALKARNGENEKSHQSDQKRVFFRADQRQTLLFAHRSLTADFVGS